MADPGASPTDITIQSAVSTFEGGQQVYTANGMDPAHDLGVDMSKVQQALADHPDVHLAVVPDSVVQQDGGIGATVQDLVSQAGPGSAYVVVAPHDIGIFDPNGAGQQVYDKLGGQDGHTAMLVYAIDHATDTPSSGTPSVAGAWLPLVIAVAATAGGVAVWRRRSSRKDHRRYRADIQAEVDSLGDDLRIMDPGGNPDVVGAHSEAGPVERALAVAWSRHAAAGGMIAGARDAATVSRARTLVRQGRAALEHARRLREGGVPDESQVYASAGDVPGPLPSERRDGPPEGAATRSRLLQQYTVASYPGYGYGWYPRYGWGFFDYAGSFVAGMLAGELLDEAFLDPAAYGGAYGPDYVGHGSWAGAWSGGGDVGGGGWGGGDIGGGSWDGGDVGGGGWGGGDGGGGGGW